MGIFMCQARTFGYGVQNPFLQQNKFQKRIAEQEGDRTRERNLMTAKRMLTQKQVQKETVDENGRKIFCGQTETSVLAGVQSYANALSTSRSKSKDTKLQLKKLRYNFKSISTQLMRSKTSMNAKQVAGKAKREVIRLKRLKMGGSYDEEEITAAITHAQKIERVAKKKVRHLLEEEMVKVTGGPCMDGSKETEEEKSQKPDASDSETEMDEAAFQESADWDETAWMSEMQQGDVSYEELLSQQMESIFDMSEQIMELSEEMTGTAEGMDEMFPDMMEEMWDSLNELLEEMGLGDLADSMSMAPDTEMDPADLKMMKIKHRCKELKEIAEADREYLKAVFDKLQKEQALGTAGPMSMPGGGGVSAVSGIAGMAGSAGMLATPSIDAMAASDAAGSMACGGDFDVSV